jgi:hypothetical protein
MPRDNQGNYSLPATNPVAEGTVVSVSWANGTMADIAGEITQSLDRNGRGSMNVSFKNGDGVVGAPGIAWADEPESGFYRAGDNDMRASINGVDTVRYSIDPVAPGLQRPFEIWDGSAFVKPLIGAGEAPDFTDVTVEGSMAAPGLIGNVQGFVGTLDVGLIASGFSMAYGYITGAGANIVAASSFGIASAVVASATEIDVTFNRRVTVAYATAMTLNPVNTYHNVNLTVVDWIVYNDDTIRIDCGDPVTGARADFSIFALLNFNA